MGDDEQPAQLSACAGYKWTAQDVGKDVYRVDGPLQFPKPKMGAYTQKYVFLALGTDDASQPGDRGEMMSRALGRLDHYFSSVLQHELADDDSTWQSKGKAHVPGTRRPSKGTCVRCNHRKRKSGGAKAAAPALLIEHGNPYFLLL